jgi:hypothetical protein
MSHLRGNHKEISSKGELAVIPRELFSWPQTSMENMNCEVITGIDFIAKEVCQQLRPKGSRPPRVHEVAEDPQA